MTISQLNAKLDLNKENIVKAKKVILFEGEKSVMKYEDYSGGNNISGIKDRFWDCVIIDGFINNSDRNNGNWGILRSESGDVLSPIYDNGASFL